VLSWSGNRHFILTLRHWRQALGLIIRRLVSSLWPVCAGFCGHGAGPTHVMGAFAVAAAFKGGRPACSVGAAIVQMAEGHGTDANPRKR
jgi:hypothetical protein